MVEIEQISTSEEEKSSLPNSSTLIGLALALGYAVGLLTTNAFLRSHGLSDFSLLRPKAIFTGAMVIGTLSLIAIFPARVAAHVIQLRYLPSPQNFLSLTFFKQIFRLVLSRKIDVWKSILSWMALVLACSFFAFYQSKLQMSGKPNSAGEYWTKFVIWQGLKIATELYLFASAVKILGILVVRFDHSTLLDVDIVKMARAWTNLTIMITLLFLAFSVYISAFARSVYVIIPHQYGGGRPDCLKFEIKADATMTQAAAMKDLGIKVNKNITNSLPVIYESEREFTVIVPNGNTSFRTVALSRELINASIWDEAVPGETLRPRSCDVE